MKKILTLTTLITILLVNLASAVDTTSCYGYGGMLGMMSGIGGYGYGYGMMTLAWLTYILIIGLIIAAIYWLVKSATHKK